MKKEKECTSGFAGKKSGGGGCCVVMQQLVFMPSTMFCIEMKKMTVVVASPHKSVDGRAPAFLDAVLRSFGLADSRKT